MQLYFLFVLRTPFQVDFAPNLYVCVCGVREGTRTRTSAFSIENCDFDEEFCDGQYIIITFTIFSVSFVGRMDT